MKLAVRVTLVIILVITGLFALGIVLVYSTQDRVLPKVQADGINLGGLKKEEGQRALLHLEEELKSKPVILRCQGKNWPLALNQVNFKMDTAMVMKEALAVGHTGSFFRRGRDIIQVWQKGHQVPLVIILNKEKFNRILDKITKEVGFLPQDAAFRVLNNDTILIIPAREGLGVNKQQVYHNLLSSLNKKEKELIINLSLAPLRPKRTTQEVEAMGLKGLLSAYTTFFEASSYDRAYNIRVAAGALDGLTVPPGQEFSFNKVVGPRSSEAGYKDARIIFNNQFVTGPGGGVCQVSTTLYNVVLLANLEIITRTSHSLPVTYVPLGRDATVVYEAIDLRFRNNTESYILIKSFVTGGSLTFKIYGNTDYKVPVKINTVIKKVFEPKIVYEADPNLKKGEEVIKQKGLRGYQVTAERVVTEDGQIKRKPLPGSLYRPLKQIVAVGTKEEEVAAPSLEELPAENAPEENTPAGNTPAEDSELPAASPLPPP
ncbi:MAG: VanW family protein [Peptococcaceae bacterium]